MGARYPMAVTSIRFVLSIIVVSIAPFGCDRDRPSGESAANAEESFEAARAALARRLAVEGLEDARVLEAIALVPRHRFVVDEYRDQSYQNRALPIAEGQTASQPSVIARMLELLELRGDEKVLEVGTGSGYQAALLGRLAGEVYTIEIREPLAERARRVLDDLCKERVLEEGRVHVIEGDGSAGHEAAAPFDRIVVNAASNEVPQALLDQLAPGGRLVMPVGNRIQELALIHKEADGSLRRESHDVVRFRPLEE